MDEKMQEYHEKIKNGFMNQSPGIKGVFTNSFKSTITSSQLRNQRGQASEGFTPLQQQNFDSNLAGSISNSRIGSYRSPAMPPGIKVDKANKRLVINDEKILSLLSAER